MWMLSAVCTARVVRPGWSIKSAAHAHWEVRAVSAGPIIGLLRRNEDESGADVQPAKRCPAITAGRGNSVLSENRSMQQHKSIGSLSFTIGETVMPEIGPIIRVVGSVALSARSHAALAVSAVHVYKYRH